MKPFNFFFNKRKSFLLLFLLSFLINYLPAQSLPKGFARVNISAGSLRRPTAIAIAPDGRIFVTLQAGQIYIVKNNKLVSVPLIKIPTNSAGEGGLTGITFDPGFAGNGFFYVYYTLADGSRNRISRFTSNGDVADLTSEMVLRDLDPNGTSNRHFGGALHFGLDGKLYISIGDNTFPENSQNLNTYFGKILRLNPDGSIPADNPFKTGSEQTKCIWAYGVRHPYTFAIQPNTGKIFLNDVGEKSWEEIDDATIGGKNFGWPKAEGDKTGYATPVYAYPHALSGNTSGCAITGGAFFNPIQTNYPASFKGKYFFLDHCNGWINVLDFSTAKPSASIFATDMGKQILALEISPDGNLYYLEESTWTLYKIQYSSNPAPSIITQPYDQSVYQDEPAKFSVTAIANAPLSYQWQKNNVNISGETSSTLTNTSVKAKDIGQYRVVISTPAGNVTSNNVTLKIIGYNAKPVAKVNIPSQGLKYRAGDTISFAGSAVDEEDGVLSPDNFSWTIDFHHDTHIHPGPSVPDSVTKGQFVVAKRGEVSPNVWYSIRLTVKDSKGITDTASTDIFPYKSLINLITEPAGLKVLLDDQPVATPVTTEGVERFERTIGVLSPQINAGKKYIFSKWKHGGTPAQNLLVPEGDTTFTAVFKELPVDQDPDSIVSKHKTVIIEPNPVSPGQEFNVKLWAESKGEIFYIRIVNAIGEEVTSKRVAATQSGINNVPFYLTLKTSAAYIVKVESVRLSAVRRIILLNY
jgi:glucose/arabinose dehydrogenase